MQTGHLPQMTSISGYCISVNPEGPPISWKSKKQSAVALSTCEAEYMSLSFAYQEVKYLTKLIKDLVPTECLPALMYNDSQGAIALVKNPMKHTKSKHIDIRYHFIRECYENNNISIDYVPSNKNIADMFTKPPKKNMLIDFKEYLFGQ